MRQIHEKYLHRMYFITHIHVHAHTHTHQKCNAHSSNWKWVFHSCTLATEKRWSTLWHYIPKYRLKDLSHIWGWIFSLFFTYLSFCLAHSLIIELQICIITGKMCKKRKDTKNATAKMCIAFKCVCVSIFIWVLFVALKLLSSTVYGKLHRILWTMHLKDDQTWKSLIIH